MTFSDSQRFIGFLHTPSIYKEGYLNYQSFQFQKITTTAFDEAIKLIEFPAKIRLGRRIEKYVSFFLEKESNIEILAENLQIFDKKKTIGELDYILKDKAHNQIIHLELAYKFYLLDADIAGEEIQKWIGPNRKDSLYLKTKKLVEHQFPILHKENTRKKLSELYIDSTKIEQQICFLGQLFLPYKMDEKVYSSKMINQEGIVGKWISFSNFNFELFGLCEFCFLTKKDWLINPELITEWRSFNEIIPIIETVDKEKQSVMIVIKNASQYVEKLFVVWW